PVGHAYVYRIYGVHWCFNIVAGEQPGGAVLVRALEPCGGMAAMAERRGAASARGAADPRFLAGGPGRLAAALGLGGGHDGLPLDAAPFRLLGPAGLPPD